jgi:hypothetical protein
VTARNQPNTEDSGRITRTPRDQRMQYDEVRGEGDPADRAVASPAPYDVAQPGTPHDKVIVKGERERPGPTSDAQHDAPASDQSAADKDGLLQTPQLDREESVTAGGPGGRGNIVDPQGAGMRENARQDLPGAPGPAVIDDGDGTERGQNVEPGLRGDEPNSENVWRRRGSADDRDTPSDSGVSRADV